MKKILRQYFFIIILLLATGLMGYNYIFRPFEVPIEELAEDQKQGSNLDYSGVKKSAQDTLEELSSEERIYQMIAQPILIAPDFETTEIATNEAEQVDQANQETLASKTSKAGFYTIFGKGISFENAQKITTSLKLEKKVFDLEPAVAVDHEGGSVQRLSGDGFAKLDSWRVICGMNTQERTEILSQSARELKKAGIDIVLGPVIDVGNNKILKDRICSKDSYAIVADRAMDYVSVFSNEGILSVLKHFPGIGLTTKDLHTSFDYVTVLENDVKLYKYIIDQNKNVGVMSSHVGVSTQDRGIPCSVSPYCVNELKKAYPNILVFTDALEMESVAYDKDNPRVKKDLIQVSKEAILAGNDVLIYGQSVSEEKMQEIVSELVVQYRVNPRMKTLVDESVLKIIKYKYEIQ